MNNRDPFEKKLAELQFQKLPPEWREDILKAARRAAHPASREPAAPFSASDWLDAFRAFLWPNPKAWAALTACWLVIGILHFADSADPVQRVAAQTPGPPSPQLRELLREQERLLAELMDAEPSVVQANPARKTGPTGCRRQLFENA